MFVLFRLLNDPIGSNFAVSSFYICCSYVALSFLLLSQKVVVSLLFSSYFLVKTPKSLRFLYNDEVKYENPVSEYVVRGNGTAKRNALFSTHGKKLKLRIRDALQISSTDSSGLREKFFIGTPSMS